MTLTASSLILRDNPASIINNRILFTLRNRALGASTLATLVQASAKHQARLNALPSAAESQQS